MSICDFRRSYVLGLFIDQAQWLLSAVCLATSRWWRDSKKSLRSHKPLKDVRTCHNASNILTQKNLKNSKEVQEEQTPSQTPLLLNKIMYAVK